jgi:hypothetical protein
VPAQQKAAGAAFAVKRGDARVSDLAEASRSMHDSITEDEREDLASAKRRDLPERKGGQVTATGQAPASVPHAAPPVPRGSGRRRSRPPGRCREA